MFTLSPQQGDAVRKIRKWFKTDTASKLVFVLCGFAGTGKAQPLTSLIQTPYGPKPMGAIRLGDAVLDHTGRAVEVVGIAPQGIQPCYRVEFRDGTATLCHPEHLWMVWEGASAFGRGPSKIVSTKDMVETGVLRPCGLMRYRVPLAAPVEFVNSGPLEIDPWVLGVLIGDGSMCNSSVNLTVSNTQPEIADRFANSLPEGVIIGGDSAGQGCRQLRTRGVGTTGNPLMRSLRLLGLAVKGPNKFIPEAYLRSSVEERYELLRGLMDSDGCIRGNRVSYSTSSERLADDIASLVRSLGGTAVVRAYERTRDGRSKIEFDVNVKTLENPFWLPIKADKWSLSWKNPPSKYIRSIKAVEPCEQQCIMVDSDDGLYLTDDYIVTHNSTILPDILTELGLSPNNVAFAAPTGKAAKVMGNKLRAQGINVYPSTIHSLIYQPKPQKAEVLERELAETTTMIMGLKDGSIHPPSGDLKADLHESEKKLHILTRDLDRAYDLNDLRFSLNPESRLVKEEIRLIILDEGSMIDEDMANDLMEFEIPILVMGDPGQLPPVGGDPGFLNGVPDAFLTEVHRQAADNPIIYLATLVRKGGRPDYGDYGDGVLVVPPKRDDYTLDLSRDCQVIVGTNKNRWKQTSRMRKAGGFLDPLPHKGEPLIMCKNSRLYPELVNGTSIYAAEDHGDAEDGLARFLAHIHTETGTKLSMYAYQGLFEEHIKRVKNFSSADKSVAFRSRINDHQMDFGWAITCHKAQGSQYDEVIVHDDSGSFREDADKWYYTAITRAAERLVIVS